MSTDTPPSPRSGERIAKLLARAGVASRREVERMIESGRVKLGDVVITTPNTVLANLKGVSVDDIPVKAPEAARLFVFHKPSGLITAEYDPAGRPTIYAALRNALPPGTPRLMPVGRLDFNTEGLLLMTNDGGLKRAMELPSSGVPRTYRARTYGDISQAQLEELIHGITIEGIHYGKINANMERRTGRNQWVEMTITEGKNREVRRVLEHLGLEVSRLLRTAYGPFELLDLPRGQAVEVRQLDVERFLKSLKVPGSGEALPPPQYAAHQARARVQRTRSAAPSRPPERPERPERPARPEGTQKPYAGKPRSDGPRSDGPRHDGPRADAARSGKPRGNSPRANRALADGPLLDGPRSDGSRYNRTARPGKSGPGKSGPGGTRSGKPGPKPRGRRP